MSIWEYRDSAREISTEIASSSECPYCKTALTSLCLDAPKPTPSGYIPCWAKSPFTVALCETCGWWRTEHYLVYEDRPFAWRHCTYIAAAALRNLDLTDLSVPISDAQAFIVARYERRFSVHPRLLEEVVAATCRDLGFHCFVTAYTCDGGVDVVLQGPSDELVGVQVKRHRGRIKAEQIRSFAGALILRGCTQGVFVTTGEYQRGALRTAHHFGDRGVAIALMDAQAFFDALKIAKRHAYTTDTVDTAPFHPFTLPSSALRLAHDYLDEPTTFEMQNYPDPAWI
jgi:restriction system protein